MAGIPKLRAPKLIGTHNWLTFWYCCRTSPSRGNKGNGDDRRNDNSNGGKGGRGLRTSHLYASEGAHKDTGFFYDTMHNS